jgi:uncharacterized protein (DUF3820 family)
MEFHVLILSDEHPVDLIGPFSTRASAEAEAAQHDGARVIESRPPAKPAAQDGRIRMPFGKHKGEALEDIPSGYLEWCLSAMERLEPKLQEEMEAQIQMRRGEGAVRKAGR